MTETTTTERPVPQPRLKLRYREEIAQELRKQFGYANVMQIPGLTKIVVNMGVGEASRDSKLIEGAVKDLTAITGQKPLVTKARKSIAQFKLREGMPIGAHVTLRGDRMWEFLDRLLSLALPRIRDFRGLDPGSFDGRGNFSLGIREQIIFPEIDYDQIAGIRGLDVAITTTAPDDDQGLALLRDRAQELGVVQRGLDLPAQNDRPVEVLLRVMALILVPEIERADHPVAHVQWDEHR